MDSDVQEPLLRATRQRKNEAERENFTSYQVTDDQSIDLQRCLTLTDLVSLNLQNCHLVTLSACESGFTDFRALSDEYMGLPSGFLIAGAPTVVCSLWIVNDLSTALLMYRFYQNLNAGGVIVRSLNQAQRWLRNLTKADLEAWIADHPRFLDPSMRLDLSRRLYPLSMDAQPFKSPFYWAAFCAIGR